MLRRRSFLSGLAAAGAVAGCGFSPVYAPRGAGEDLRGRIRPDPPASRVAFAFVAQLEDRLGRAESGDLRLSYTLDLTEERLALSGSGSNLRLAILGTATYQVRRGSEVLTRGQVTGSASFTDRGTSVAVRTARADARRRTGIVLADEVANRLIATAGSWLI